MGQRLMQSATDIFLGSFRVPGGEDYYVRQLRDMKVSAELETFSRKLFVAYATICGWALARSHAKARGAAMIAGYVAKSERLDDVLVSYAQAYADQVEPDSLAFRRPYAPGASRPMPGIRRAWISESELKPRRERAASTP